MDHLSIGEARRMALAAAGLHREAPRGEGRSQAPPEGGRPTRRDPARLGERRGAVALHAVLLACSGPYPSRRARHARVGTHHLFEYWGHQASLLPVEQHPLHRWKMAQHRHDRQSAWLIDLEKKHPGYIEAVLDEVRERGPLAAGELSDPGKKSGPWWGYSKGKQTLEYLFWTGQVTANRRTNFERVYDVPERAIPAEVLAAPTPTEHGGPQGAARDRRAGARCRHRGRPHELLRAQRPEEPGRDRRARRRRGARYPTAVEGWKQATYRHRDAKLPRKVEATALLDAVRQPRVAAPARRASCSTSTTASRSTRPRRSACTATTCCRSCTATPSWPRRREGRPQGEDAAGARRVRGAGRRRSATVADALAGELSRMATGGSASNASRSAARVTCPTPVRRARRAAVRS